MIHKAKKSLGLKIRRISPETSSFRAKKSLGQNFLKSKPALNMMGSVSNINKNDIILEIGPGKGALTKKLLLLAKKVVAVEKDSNLILHLKEKFSKEINSGSLVLVEEDILNFNLIDFKKYNLLNKKYKIIANIPYNITGAIFKKFLSSEIQPSVMTLLVQKEVAERIVARDKKESILSLSIKAYGDPSYVMKVGKRFFSPSPKVDSAIISIKNISKNNFKSEKEEKLFFEIIKTGFAHKRKILKKNLENIEKEPKQIEKIFEKLKINPKTRAENIPIEVWLKITQYF